MKQIRRIIALLAILAAPAWAQDESQLAGFFRTDDFGRARSLLAQLIDRQPLEHRHRYNLACAEARLGFKELALDALDSAVRLGFTDWKMMLADEDLAGLRDTPRFQSLARKLSEIAARAPANPADAKAAPTQPVEPSSQGGKVATTPNAAPRPEISRASMPLPMPVEPRITADGPVGLYFMTRFWISSGLEQKIWYFDAAGSTYLSPGSSFSPEALEHDSARHGRRVATGDKLKVDWSDGKVTDSSYKVDSSQTGFSWDAGIFSAVPRPDWTNVAGHFEGGASFSNASGGGASVSALTLRPDKTFAWSRSASIRGETPASTATAGSAGRARTGRWTGEGYQLTLTFDDGSVERFVAFPVVNAKNRAQIEMLFFNGSMHLAKPQ